ncbi:twin-arginine translocase subunit TatC [bacterium]|nr:twin-arginine translocase subunit TatC [candidate division CSSED10-310 bacterium]
MTILEHLTELRACLIKSLAAVGIGAVICFAFAEHIFDFLSEPLIRILPQANREMVFTSLPEVFFVYIKVALFAGILLASPVIFHQIWKFVAPALYSHEKRYVIPFVLISTVFFLLGAAFSYYQIFPYGFKFFIGFSDENIRPMITLKDYLKFSTRLLLAFGLVFEMPIVISFLAKLGLVTPAFLRKNRKYALLIIVIIAAILTPPDIVTQLMMAGPMYVLYELSILSAMIFGRKSRTARDSDNQ